MKLETKATLQEKDRERRKMAVDVSEYFGFDLKTVTAVSA